MMDNPYANIIKTYDQAACSVCRGTKTVDRKYRQGGWAGENVTVQEECPECKGRGRIFPKGPPSKPGFYIFNNEKGRFGFEVYENKDGELCYEDFFQNGEHWMQGTFLVKNFKAGGQWQGPYS